MVWSQMFTLSNCRSW